MTRKRKICLFFIPLLVTTITLVSILTAHASPAPPDAQFTWNRELAPYTPETSPTVDETVKFDASASTPNGGAITSYAWDFDDGNNGTGKIVNHMYTTAGTYNVTLNVTDSEGEWDTVSRLLQVVKKPCFSINPPQKTVPAPGTSFTVDVNITDAFKMYGWSLKLQYDTFILDATLISPTNLTEGAPTWVPTDENGTWHPDGPPNLDDSIGRIFVGAIFAPGTTFTGNGTLIRINFTATRAGETDLSIYDTEVIDFLSDLYMSNTVDGHVSVVPEYSTLIIPVLLVASLTVTLLGKKSWSRKRKNVFITK